MPSPTKPGSFPLFFCQQLLHLGHLVTRKQIAEYMGNADRFCNLLSNLFLISGQHHQSAHTLLFQTCQHGRNVRTHTVGNDDRTQVSGSLCQIQGSSQYCRRRAYGNTLPGPSASDSRCRSPSTHHLSEPVHECRDRKSLPPGQCGRHQLLFHMPALQTVRSDDWNYVRQVPPAPEVSSLLPCTGETSVTSNLPVVRVPVLSKTAVSRFP